MPSFQCDSCGDVIKKPKTVAHSRSCMQPFAGFTCLDCHAHFDAESVKAHIQCISEAEKYQGALYRPPKQKGQQTPNSKPLQGQQQKPVTPANQTTTVTPATASPAINKRKAVSTPKTEQKTPASEEQEASEQIEQVEPAAKRRKTATAVVTTSEQREAKSEEVEETEEAQPKKTPVQKRKSNANPAPATEMAEAVAETPTPKKPRKSNVASKSEPEAETTPVPEAVTPPASVAKKTPKPKHSVGTPKQTEPQQEVEPQPMEEEPVKEVAAPTAKKPRKSKLATPKKEELAAKQQDATKKEELDPLMEELVKQCKSAILTKLNAQPKSNQDSVFISVSDTKWQVVAIVMDSLKSRVEEAFNSILNGEDEDVVVSGGKITFKKQ